jgi:hypothetical protein
VIDVGMGEEERGNLTGMKAPRFSVAPFHLLPALEKPAVDQVLPAIVEEEAGTGNAARGAVTRNLHKTASSLGPDPRGHEGLYQIIPTRHPGMLPAGVQDYKELDSGQLPE